MAAKLDLLDILHLGELLMFSQRTGVKLTMPLIRVSMRVFNPPLLIPRPADYSAVMHGQHAPPMHASR